MRTFDEESIELLKHGYRQVVYFELYCGRHGAIRGTEDGKPTDLRCPFCGRSCEGSVIGRGFTRRKVPLVEVVAGPLNNQTPSYVRLHEERRAAAKARRVQPHFMISPEKPTPAGFVPRSSAG